MELSLICTCLVVVLLIFLPLIIYLIGEKSRSHNLPPGRRGWPIIGESLEYVNTGRRGAPQKFVMDRMAKFSSQVFTTSLLGETVAVFCGSEGNKFLFSNENKLVSVWYPKTMDNIFPFTTSTRSETAKNLRVYVVGFLKPEALQRYIGIIDSAAKSHLDMKWSNQKQVTVGPLIKEFAFSLACKFFLSLDDPIKIGNMSESFAIIVSGLFSVPINLPGTKLNRANKASAVLRKQVLEIVKQRKIDLTENKASPTQDVLSHMLVTTDENGVFLGEMIIAEMIIGLLLGGHDTVTGVITFLIKYLAELPDVYNQVFTEQMDIANLKGGGELLDWGDIHKMKYSWNVVCEVMRLSPPVQGNFREALTDFTYAGFLIPKGMKLYWSTFSTHRNGDYFPNPEKFDPSRFQGNGPPPYTYTPLGGGIRMCPGKEYSRLTILLFLHNLVRRYKWEKVIPNEKIVVDPIPKLKKGLPIRLESHTY